MVKTIVASFDGYQAAQKAVRDLINDGFMSHDISILASNMSGEFQTDDGVRVTENISNTATGAVTGGLVGGAAGLAAGLLGLAIPAGWRAFQARPIPIFFILEAKVLGRNPRSAAAP